MEALQGQQGIGARALEFCILTATRTNETIGAVWDEFNMEEGIWTIPAVRMKMAKDHRVPLVPAAMSILEAMRVIGANEYVFPGARHGKSMSNMAFLQLLKRMERSDITPHGFRSTFRDWASERTNFPREVCEMSLAHAIGDKVEAAYRRGDLFEKRRKLMEAWAGFCTTKPTTMGDVVPLARKA